MVNTSRLLEMARKWKRMATLGRKRISWTTKNFSNEAATLNKKVADKGHFYAYTSDGKRFMIPLTFLNNAIFEELMKMTQEEFGLPRDGPITLPCDAAFLEFVLLMIKRRISEDIDCEFLMSNFRRHCTQSLIQDMNDQKYLEVF